MAYTDIWKCRKCDTLPEIVMLGKNFLIECKVCTHSPPSVYGTTLQEVVDEWNRLNKPPRPGISSRIIEEFRRLKDAMRFRQP